MAKITLGGTPCETHGDLPVAGSKAPDFRLVGKDLADVTLSDFAGKHKILNIVPSLDTPVCVASTRKFNEKAASLADTVVLVVSADLPFAQARACSTAGIEGVVTLSMMRGKNFAKDYGVLITSGAFEGLAARCVVVVDRADKVLHTQLVGEIGDEPDYDAALAALR